MKASDDAIVAGADSKLSSSVVATVTTWGLSETVFVRGAILCLLEPSPSTDRKSLHMYILFLIPKAGLWAWPLI